MKKGLLKYVFPLICLAMLALAPDANAQQRQITGKITDSETGEGFPGVSVLEVGTSNGTVTDLNGNYSLSVGSGARLSFSFIGYVTQEVEVGSRSVIDVPLALDVKQLQELVITGYTVDNRRETSGSISTVKPKDIAVIPTGNVEQSLAGRIAGVNVITNGQPGSTSQIRVRGFGAFGGNEPLYVVDGVPVGSTDFLSPDDIESTTVLKDAAAASIYGARAANGVIVYTTKKGSKGAKKISIDYNSMFGFTTPGVGIDMMNPADFAEWTWNAERNQARADNREPVFSHPQFGTGTTPVLPDYLSVGGTSGFIGNVNLADEATRYNIDPSVGGVYQVTRAATGQGTDWYGAISRVAPMQRQTLGLHGGTDRSRYYFSLSLQDQGGPIIYNDFKRYSFRANSEFDLLPNLRFGENMQFTYRSVLGQQGNAGGQGVADDENDVLAAFRMPTIIPVYDEFGGYAGTASRGFNNPRNPVASRDGQQNNRNFNGNGFGNVYLEYDPIPGLTLRSTLGGQYNNYYFWGYGRRQYENSENNSAFSYNEGGGWSFGWNFTNTINYKKTFGIHNIDLLAGQEALNTGVARGMSADGLNPFSQDLDYITISTLDSRNPPNSFYGKGVNFSSLFGRANYILNDKYIFSAVLRRDGSSRFGSENRYGVFPAFSAAWRLSSESFMSSLTFIDDLKIRGGYGLMGNSNNVDPNNQYSLYASNIGASWYDINGNNGSAPGFFRSRIGNPAAKWETSVTQNIGIDGTFLDGKLDVIVDFWAKDTRDLLFSVQVPSPLGVNAAAPSVNIGEMSNKGIDLQIINRGNLTSDLTYELNVTGSLLKNEIVFLQEGLEFFTAGTSTYRGIAPIRNQVGYSLSSFFGFDVVGLFEDAAEVASAPTQAGAAPGRFRYRDIDGNGVINNDDRTFLGSPVAPFTGGLTFSLGYKNFDIATYFYTSIGNEIWNQSRWFTDFYPSFAGAAIAERVKDSWTPTNTNTDHPVFDKASNFSTNTQANSYYVENGSYLRMQNVTLGYKMPADLLSRLSMTQLRIFVSANNLLTITGYEGLDPSVGGNADLNFGVDVGNIPLTRSYTAGIQLGF